MRRSLVGADIVGLSVAFIAAQTVSAADVSGEVSRDMETLLFLATLPLWVAVAHLYGLYGRDEQRTAHSTVDDLVSVFHLVTIGSWLFFAATWLSGAADPNLEKIAAFWLLAIALVVGARFGARVVCRRSPAFVQRAVVVGAGDVGQLIGRKLEQHPEYGIELVGFVDADPGQAMRTSSRLAVLGPPERLAEIVRRARRRPCRHRVLETSATTNRSVSSARSATSTSRSTSCPACSRRSGQRPRSTPSRAFR